MSTRVFVCSTVFDLIDMRAELEAELTAMGLTPVMSDRASSDFDVPSDRNSIDACLVNVESCDVVLVVLSRRYGPSLRLAGYDDISATHLEYRHARKLGKPVHLYARDRLEADYRLQKDNAGTPVKLSWVAPKDTKLLNLLQEHRDLVERQEGSNWFWTFRDSVELKARVRKDLAVAAGEARLRRLVDAGRMPFVGVLTTSSVDLGTGWHTTSMFFTNLADVPVLGLRVGAPHGFLEATHVGDLLPRSGQQAHVRHVNRPQELESLLLTYGLAEGFVIRDEFIRADDASIARQPKAPLPVWKLAAKVLVGSVGYDLRVEQEAEASGGAE